MHVRTRSHTDAHTSTRRARPQFVIFFTHTYTHFTHLSTYSHNGTNVFTHKPKLRRAHIHTAGSLSLKYRLFYAECIHTFKHLHVHTHPLADHRMIIWKIQNQKNLLCKGLIFSFFNLLSFIFLFVAVFSAVVIKNTWTGATSLSISLLSSLPSLSCRPLLQNLFLAQGFWSPHILQQRS